MIICPNCYYNGEISELVNKPCQECKDGIVTLRPDDGVSFEVPCSNEDCDWGTILEYYHCPDCGEDVHESEVLLLSYRDGSYPTLPKEGGYE